MSTCQSVEAPSMDCMGSISHVRIMELPTVQPIDDKDIRIHIMQLNDRLHRRTFMTRDQFYEAIRVKATGFAFAVYETLITADHGLLYEADLRANGNYYPEYIRLLTKYPVLI